MAKPAPTVYSYYSPEIENTIREAMLRLNTGLRTDHSIHELLQQNFHPGLDDLHHPAMRLYEQFARSEGVVGLESLPEKWFTAGSSEAIFHLMNGLLPAEQLYQFDGEYQGFRAYADAVGRPMITVEDMDDLMHSMPGVVWLSNPQSKNGMIMQPEMIKEIGTRHRIVMDLAYMGMTKKPLNVDLTNPAIMAVVGSLSKPFGLYYYRIGFCYSRWNIPSLYGTKWFKNALSIKLAEAVLEEATTKKWGAFKDKYFKLQGAAVKDVNGLFGITDRGGLGKDAKPSDVWLLAYAPLRDTNPQDLAPFKRGNQNYRFCLTPYYMEWRNA